ncbi:MAG TPA: quinol:electron acceptor oxidoreductase subunit ActD, partial [Gemmatimonadaceae bacterium]|nr:quinol:electron acceptor oxidoreductase subunit ActD [Gemmatimonadaceae bacterium]
MRPARVYGLMAEFERPEDLRRAVRTVREQGYRRLDAYTPLPIDGLAEEMGVHFSWLPLIVLVSGIIGGAGGFLMQ